MKITIPTADYPPIEGGISTVTLQVSRELAKLGHDVAVIAPRFPDMGEFDAGEPVRVTRYAGYGLGWLRYLPMSSASRSIMKRSDYVIAVNVAYGGLMAKRSGVPYITFAYGFEFLKYKSNPFIRKLLLGVYGTSRKIVAISSFTRDALVEFGVDPAKVAVVLPGASVVVMPDASAIQTARERLRLNGGPIILAVGRFVPRKGHTTLIRALPMVLEKFPRAQLVLVGRGPCMAETQTLADQLGVGRHVRFTSRVDDPELSSYYTACDVFALPAGEGPGGQVEGFGLVFAEAQARGKPVIAGRSGGTRDAVIDGQTGLIVPPEDPDALASALLNVLTDHKLADRLSQAGRKRIETELNWGHFTRSVAALMENHP